MSAKILVLDIETAPMMAYVWKRWKENVGQEQLIREGYVLCVCWKWLGQANTGSVAIADMGENDAEVVKAAWRLLDEADIVVAHNAKGFDLPTLNARFLALGLPPPRPYRVVDTLEVARKKFRWSSASLDSISYQLLGARKSHTSFALWKGCMAGEPAAWRSMVSYCKRDVNLLARVYLKMRPWIDGHPNVNLFDPIRNPACPRCGSLKIQRRGEYQTSTLVYQRYQCQSCNGWLRSRTNCLEKDERQIIHTPA